MWWGSLVPGGQDCSSAGLQGAVWEGRTGASTEEEEEGTALVKREDRVVSSKGEGGVPWKVEMTAPFGEGVAAEWKVAGGSYQTKGTRQVAWDPGSNFLRVCASLDRFLGHVQLLADAV